jgi:LPS export ABC transporter protein LptC
MKDGKLNRIKYLFLVLILISMGTLCSCFDEDDTVEEKSPTVEQTIEKFVITETKDGKIKTILESESAIIYEDKKLAYLTAPKVKFYEDGKYKSTLIAETGEINLNTNNIKAFGECTVDTVQKEHLQTRDVTYDANKKIIYSDNDIKITRGKDVIFGKGFKSDTDLNNIEIKHQKITID